MEFYTAKRYYSAMSRADDAYRLGWRFWSRHLLRSAFVAAAVFALSYFLDEPPRPAASFILIALIFLGPALHAHYYGPKKR